MEGCYLKAKLGANDDFYHMQAPADVWSLQQQGMRFVAVIFTDKLTGEMWFQILFTFEVS